MASAIDTAVDAFKATLVKHGALTGTAEGEAAEIGRRAALLVSSSTAWQEHLGELLDLPHTMSLLGVSTRQAVYDLVARHRLLGLRRQGGAMAFPAFQFDPASGRPYEPLPSILSTFADAGVDAYTIATWLATGQDELDGQAPISLLGQPAASSALQAAAQRTAARLSH